MPHKCILLRCQFFHNLHFCYSYFINEFGTTGIIYVLHLFPSKWSIAKKEKVAMTIARTKQNWKRLPATVTDTRNNDLEPALFSELPTQWGTRYTLKVAKIERCEDASVMLKIPSALLDAARRYNTKTICNRWVQNRALLGAKCIKNKFWLLLNFH